MRWSTLLFVLFAGSATAAPVDPTARPPSTAPAEQHITGDVKAIDAANHKLTVTADGKDTAFDITKVSLPSDVVVGARVDVTFIGATASKVVKHDDKPAGPYTP